MHNLEVNAVSYAFGDHVAVNGVSFELARGELAMLIGRNGSGKSTLLRCIAGWLEPQAGQVSLLGKTAQSMQGSLRNHLVFVPDTPPAYAALTAWESLQLVGQVNRVPDWKARATELLQRFGLDTHHHAMPAALSRGQRYKLALCAAFLLNADVLLLDEPFGPLDPLSVRALWADLKALTAQGTSVLISNHHASRDIEPDRYLVMEAGNLIADGSPDDLRAHYHLDTADLDQLLEASLSEPDAEG